MNERTFHAANAHRLEDPERLVWLPPDEVVKALNVNAGMTVADIGAGTGYFSLPLAAAVGPSGKVYAVDFQAEMLNHVREKLERMTSTPAISITIGEASKTSLPDSAVEMAFYANVWHEFDAVEDVLKEAARILRPRGRLAILDWRADLTPPPGPPSEHRIGYETVRGVLARNGWTAGPAENIGRYSYLLQATQAGF